ncbi:Uncharacterised protein [Mesomycoplasma neurolyticum]|uniref:Uncharacterized protein n=2 Tax=Mesomycoplasma neurolyticum TaxID=2120 RepID=A0A449A500_9BACT|nr:Uncharacterised protein [Mesomycoplasma neurolyticum]
MNNITTIENKELIDFVNFYYKQTVLANLTSIFIAIIFALVIGFVICMFTNRSKKITQCPNILEKTKIKKNKPTKTKEILDE